jgi:anti-anti-sigma regulatory factor
MFPSRARDETTAMLRITTQEYPPVLLLRLEGRLEGQYVGVLENTWQALPNGSSGTRVCLDLAGVTFIDSAGKSLLMAMHRHGAEFIAGNLLTKAIVAEIVGP